MAHKELKFNEDARRALDQHADLGDRQERRAHARDPRLELQPQRPRGAEDGLARGDAGPP